MLRTSKMLAKIRAGQVARVCSTGSPLVYLPAMAAHLDYDAVWVDGEHRAWNPEALREMTLRHHQAGIDCIIRPPHSEKAMLSRLLEDGATGLMIPQVNTAERARDLVQSTKFHPLGERGLDGSGLDSGFFVGRPADYVSHSNRETALILQIETPAGVAAAAEIAAVEGVDLLFIGPGDLSLRLGCTPSLQEPAIRRAIETVANACQAHGKPWGYPVNSVEDARIVVSLGVNMIAFGSEFLAVHQMLEACRDAMNDILGER